MSLRDRLVLGMSRMLSAQCIADLLYDDIADIDPTTQYVAAKRQIPLRQSGGMLNVDEELAEALEDYLNAQPPGRPFLDYRPSIGPYLFPSARTGGPISRWTILHIIQQDRSVREDVKPK